MTPKSQQFELVFKSREEIERRPPRTPSLWMLRFFWFWVGAFAAWNVAYREPMPPKRIAVQHVEEEVHIDTNRLTVNSTTDIPCHIHGNCTLSGRVR